MLERAGLDGGNGKREQEACYSCSACSGKME